MQIHAIVAQQSALVPLALGTVYFKLHPYAQGEGIGGNSGNVMAAMN